MRESRAEGSEGRAKLRDERHSHVIRERLKQKPRERQRQTAVVEDHWAEHMRIKATHVYTHLVYNRHSHTLTHTKCDTQEQEQFSSRFRIEKAF